MAADPGKFDLPKALGRYELHHALASGGMGTVHLGRLVGEVGFSRAVALKRLRPAYARDETFVRMFLDEARLAARVRHPNVVATLDVVAAEGELFVVMDYVHGESVSRLLKVLASRGERIPMPVVSAIMTDLLEGLHAAHEAKSERGESLGIVHRDVSPQNVLVGADGVTRVLDFGIARATEKLNRHDSAPPRGKLPYIPPEQLRNEAVDRRADLWATAVVGWEMLAGKRLFTASSSEELATHILESPIAPPSAFGSAPELDSVLRQALSRDPRARFASALAMAAAIEAACPVASKRTVADWLERTMGDVLRDRAAHVEKMERDASSFRPSGATGIELAGLTSKRASGAEPTRHADENGASTLVVGPEALQATRKLPRSALAVVPHLSARPSMPSPQRSTAPVVVKIAIVLVGIALTVGAAAVVARKRSRRDAPTREQAVEVAPPESPAPATSNVDPAAESTLVTPPESKGAATPLAPSADGGPATPLAPSADGGPATPLASQASPSRLVEAPAPLRRPRPKAPSAGASSVPSGSPPQSKYGREPW